MKRYQWFSVVYNHHTNQSEIVDPQCFTQENAILYSESYLFDKVALLDGIQRLSGSKKIFSTENEIDLLINNQEITNLDQHYIVSRFTQKGWVGSLVKVRIYQAPITTLSYVDEVQEIEDEEEYQEKVQIRTVIPGRVWGSTYKIEDAIVNKKRPIKKTVVIPKPVESTKMERIAISQEVLTITLARRETQGLIIDEQPSPFNANFFSFCLGSTKSFKSIQNGVSSPSKLREQYPKEFSNFQPRSSRLQKVFNKEENVPRQVKNKPEEKEYTSIASLSYEIAEIARKRLSKILQ